MYEPQALQEGPWGTRGSSTLRSLQLRRQLLGAHSQLLLALLLLASVGAVGVQPGC